MLSHLASPRQRELDARFALLPDRVATSLAWILFIRHDEVIWNVHTDLDAQILRPPGTLQSVCSPEAVTPVKARTVCISTSMHLQRELAKRLCSGSTVATSSSARLANTTMMAVVWQVARTLSSLVQIIGQMVTMLLNLRCDLSNVSSFWLFQLPRATHHVP